MINELLKETHLLDYSSQIIQKLIKQRGWSSLSEYEKIDCIYNFVRDEIEFGFNNYDESPGSKVLSDGYGHCKTKGILFMTLLRDVGIQCRFHGFTIRKEVMKGLMPGIWYLLSPKEFIHNWIEVLYKNNWYNLEGIVFDQIYLVSLTRKFASCSGWFCGYGIATDSFEKPDIFWKESDTYIQAEGIEHDFGVYNCPDDFFKDKKHRLNPFISFIFRNIVIRALNKNVKRIREFYIDEL